MNDKKDKKKEYQRKYYIEKKKKWIESRKKALEEKIKYIKNI